MRTCGTLSHDGKKAWLLDVEPHVAMRIKRVFGKIRTGAQGTLTLSDTPENAKDLQWFMERYPLVLKDHSSKGGTARYLAERTAVYTSRTTLVEDLLARRAPPPVFDLALPPRAYQAEAAALLLARGSLLLADDLGLGKTISAIAALADARTLPALVVCPTHLPKQWQDQLARFAPKLRTHILKKGTPYDIAGAMRGSRGSQLALPSALPDVIITNYHKLAGWAATLRELDLRCVVFDEAQDLRHTESAKYEAALHVARGCTYCLGLTATPVYNYGAEIFNVISVLDPDALGDRAEFLREWTTNDKSITDPRAFGMYARETGIMLRRTRAEVGRELPPLQKVPHFIEHDETAMAAVANDCSTLAKLILEGGEHLEKGAAFRAGGDLDYRLRQATGVAKAPFVAQFVKMLLDQGENVVLFGWHHAVYDIWKKKLAEYEPLMFTGEESPKEKEASRQAFMANRAPGSRGRVLIMSLRSGAGIDGLQKCCRIVVFGELDWSPGVHDQCTGRVDRDEQEQGCIAYYLIAETGSDPIVCDVLQLKREQAEGIRNPTGDLVEALAAKPGHVRKLAEAWLAQRAKKVGEAAA